MSATVAQKAALCRRPAEMRDVDDVDALGDHELQDGVAEQLFGDRDRDRSEAADLTYLVAFDGAALHRFEIDAYQAEVAA